jgi:hypothetical protein
MPDISPFIRYREAKGRHNLAAAGFGFDPESVVGDLDGTIGHTQLRAGDGVIMVSTLKDDAPGMTVPGPRGQVHGRRLHHRARRDGPS